MPYWVSALGNLFLCLFKLRLLLGLVSWYSDTRSLVVLSALAKSVSSKPSPVYQCRKGLCQNVAVNCSERTLGQLLSARAIADEGGRYLSPQSGMAQLFLHYWQSPPQSSCCSCFGVKYLFVRLPSWTCGPSMLGRSQVVAMEEVAGSHRVLGIKHSNICWVSSGTVRAQYYGSLVWSVGQSPIVLKKYRQGKGTMLTASVRSQA